MNDHKNSLVVKSNALVNAMFDLSLQGNRFLAFAISLLDRGSVPQPGQAVALEIPVLEFSQAFNMDSKNAYREIERLADQLQKKIIQLQPDQTASGRRVKVGIVTRQEYLDGEGRVWITFDDTIIPHLVGLTDQFTRYRIKDVYQFARASTWRVYELLKQFKEIGRREVEVDELKYKLGLSGRYPVLADFRKRVLDPAVDEINGTSDIQVQYDQKKRGRRVVSFLFVIVDNQSTRGPVQKVRDAARKLDSGVSFDPDLFRVLREEYGVSDTQARQLSNLARHDRKKVLGILPKIRARYDSLKTKKTSLGGYVFKALKSELAQLHLPIGGDL